MDIQNLIGEFFASSSARLFDGEAKPIPSDALRREYGAIKSFLLDDRRPGDVVAISLERGYRYVLCILACMDAGLTFLPLNPAWPRARVEQIKDLTGFSFLISAANIDEVLRGGKGAPRAPALAPAQALYIICTSGTTGRPKGVVISRGAYASYLRWLNEEFSMADESSRLLLVSDFTFDLSLADLGLLLLKRCSLHCSQFAGNIFRLAGEIEALRINGIMTVPHNLSLLLHETVGRKADLSSLRFLYIGGAPFTESLYRSFFEKFPRDVSIYNTYGPTETTISTHRKRLTGIVEDEIRDGHVSIGRPVPGVACRLVDAAGAEITMPGATGHLLLGGVQVMTGYINEPEKTRESLVEIDGGVYYRSGDVAFLDETGGAYIVGRMDDTIKRRGYRVNLSDIDAYIQRLDVVLDSATIAFPDPDLDNILVTYVIVRRPITEKELRRELAGSLVEYQFPDHIEFVDRFPLNESGKVCRRALAERFKSRPAREA